MPSIVKMLKVVADPNRLRILLLLKGEELSVAELQEILAMGQSTISTHLSQLKQAELVEDRRTGKSNLYRLRAQTRENPDSGSFVKGHERGTHPVGGSRAANRAKINAGFSPCGMQSVSGGAAGCREAIKTRWVDLVLG